MNATWKFLVGALALFATSTTAHATSYRLDFAGQTATGVYSGTIVLDYTAVDQNPSDSASQYSNLVTAASMQVNGIAYTLSSSFINSGFLFNDAPNVGDFFGIGFTVANSDTGEEDFFAIQFQQQDGSAFLTSELPTALDLTSFEPYDINNTNSTGVVLPIEGLTGTDVFLALDSATLMPVPLPAGLVLMFSALATLVGASRKRTV